MTKAIAEGYIRNLEDRKGRPARLVVGEALPDDVELLPQPDWLRDLCTYASDSQGTGDPPLPSSTNGTGPHLEETLGSAWERLEHSRETRS